MRSDKLRHFAETDPIPTNYMPEKLREREEIQSAVERYLAQGGQIQQLDATANRVPVFIVNDVVRARGKA